MGTEEWQRAADLHERRAKSKAAQMAGYIAADAERMGARANSTPETSLYIRAREEELACVVADLEAFLASEAGRQGLRLVATANNGWGILFGKDNDDYEPDSVYLLGDGFYSFAYAGSLSPESKHRTTTLEAVEYFKRYHADGAQWRSIVDWLKSQLDRLARESFGGR